MHYVKATHAPYFLMLTECGLVGRLEVEAPEKHFIGGCRLCPYMKLNSLEKVRDALAAPAAGPDRHPRREPARAAPRAAWKGCSNLHPRTDHLIDLALDEDAGLGDVTSRAIFPARHTSRAFIAARQDLVVCGLEVAARVFARVDPALSVTLTARDGDHVKKGATVLRVAGSTRSLLTAERTALNFLQRLSGIATLSRRFADAVAGTGVRVVDTRKTTPGFRALEKYAVRCGGCHNHRSSLGEHVLIKDNHIAAAGSLARAVKLARAAAPHMARIEVEAKTLAEVREAVRAGAEVDPSRQHGPCPDPRCRRPGLAAQR